MNPPRIIESRIRHTGHAGLERLPLAVPEALGLLVPLAGKDRFAALDAEVLLAGRSQGRVEDGRRLVEVDVAGTRQRLHHRVPPASGKSTFPVTHRPKSFSIRSRPRFASTRIARAFALSA